MENNMVYVLMVGCEEYAPGSEVTYSSDMVGVFSSPEKAEVAVFEWNLNRSATVRKIKDGRWKSTFHTSWTGEYEFYLRQQVVI